MGKKGVSFDFLANLSDWLSWSKYMLFSPMAAKN